MEELLTNIVKEKGITKMIKEYTENTKHNQLMKELKIRCLIRQLNYYETEHYLVINSDVDVDVSYNDWLTTDIMETNSVYLSKIYDSDLGIFKIQIDCSDEFDNDNVFMMIWEIEECGYRTN